MKYRGGNRRSPEGVQMDSCIRLYTAVGCTVFRFAEGRRTKVTPGWPDLAVFAPKIGQFWLHEVKRDDDTKGRQSPEQGRVQALCAECGVAYLLGGLTMARTHLNGLGILLESTLYEWQKETLP